VPLCSFLASPLRLKLSQNPHYLAQTRTHSPPPWKSVAEWDPLPASISQQKGCENGPIKLIQQMKSQTKSINPLTAFEHKRYAYKSSPIFSRHASRVTFFLFISEMIYRIPAPTVCVMELNFISTHISLIDRVYNYSLTTLWLWLVWSLPNLICLNLVTVMRDVWLSLGIKCEMRWFLVNLSVMLRDMEGRIVVLSGICCCLVWASEISRLIAGKFILFRSVLIHEFFF